MMNDNVIRSDHGHLKIKSYLPIRALLYGDTGSVSEYIDSTLGPIKCFFNDCTYTLSIISVYNTFTLLLNNIKYNVDATLDASDNVIS